MLLFTGAQPSLEAVERALAADNVGLADVARLGVFYPHELDHATLLHELAAAFVADARPALSAIPVPPADGQAIQIDAIASTGPLARLGRSAFPDAVVAGDLIFTSAVTSAVPANDIAGQSEQVLAQLASVLEAAGATLNSGCKLNIFYVGGGTAEDWEVAARVRARHFDEPGPAATGIPVAELGEAGALISMEVTALRDAGVPRAYSWPEGHWDWPIHLPWKHGNSAAGMAFVGGQVALTPHAEVIEPDDLEAQALIAVENIRKVLEPLGFSLDDVVKLNAFVAGAPPSGSAVPLKGPAITEVRLPFLAYERMVIEIEAIAIRRGD